MARQQKAQKQAKPLPPKRSRDSDYESGGESEYEEFGNVAICVPESQPTKYLTRNRFDESDCESGEESKADECGMVAEVLGDPETTISGQQFSIVGSLSGTTPVRQPGTTVSVYSDSDVSKVFQEASGSESGGVSKPTRSEGSGGDDHDLEISRKTRSPPQRITFDTFGSSDAEHMEPMGSCGADVSSTATSPEEPYPSDYGLPSSYLGPRPVETFADNNPRSVTRLWSAGIWCAPRVSDERYDAYRRQLDLLFKEHPRLLRDEYINTGIREAAIRLIIALGVAGIEDPSAPIRCRTVATNSYLQFSDRLDEEGNPFSIESWIENATAPDFEQAMGWTGPGESVWSDPIWDMPTSPNEDYYRIMVDLYFASLSVELSTNDHLAIRANAESYMETQGYDMPNTRMAAQLFGLRAYLAPIVLPDESVSSRKQRMNHRTLVIDDVRYQVRGPPSDPYPNLRTPRTRSAMRQANLQSFIATYEPDCGTPSPSRSGRIESGGESASDE